MRSPGVTIRTLGWTSLITGLIWTFLSIPLYGAYVTATTSQSLEILTGRESLSPDEVHAAFVHHGSEMRRYSRYIFMPAALTAIGAILLSCRRSRADYGSGAARLEK